MFFSRWYRVVAVEGKHTKLNIDGSVNTPPSDNLNRRLLTLRGPAWPWEINSQDPELQELSQDLRVGIFPSAVAVHSRTMRLEGGAGNNP